MTVAAERGEPCSICGEPVPINPANGEPYYWRGTRKKVGELKSVPDKVECVYCSAQCGLKDYEAKRKT